MNFVELKENWNRFGSEDPFWAIATEAEAKDNRWDLDAFYESGRQTVAHSIGSVLALRPELGRTRALDFGCGVGRLTRGLEPFFQEVVGVDVAASMIERARALSPPDTRCTYVLNENPDLRLFGDSSFDFVLTFIVLQHMRQEYSAKYLAEFMRILRPGGICLFQLPDFLINTAEPSSDGKPAMEMYGMSPEMVAGILAAAGGRVLQVTENDWAGRHAQSFAYTVEKVSSGGPLPEMQAVNETAADVRLRLIRTEEFALRSFDQVTELTALLKTAQTDADARLTQVTGLTALLKVALADADARLTHANELTALLKVARADADARMIQIEQLTAWLLESEADRAAKARLIEDLTQGAAAANHPAAAESAASPPPP